MATILKNTGGGNYMKAIKFIMLLMITALSSFYFTGCDKGTDTVDFSYYLDANDRRVVHFNAKGKSDYGSFDYSWNFGDGFVGTGKEITHEFADFGTFKIVLYADIDDSNISTSVTKEIEVEIPKITDLDFEITPDKKSPRLYNFRANSNTDYGNVEYSWNFGDGSTASGDNIQYGFEYFGVYNIELLGAISQYDKISSITKKDVLISPPAITRLEIYAEQDGSNPFLYHFKPIAEASWGTLEYEWSFGDGRIALDDEVTNIYTNYQNYIVKLKAKIVETNAEEIIQKEIVVQKPVFKNYEITHKIDANDPLQVYFTIENKDEIEEDMSQQDSFTWELGDGNTASGLRVNHRFESYGEKTIYVTLRTSDQTQKTLIKTITLGEPLIQNIKITGQPSLKAGNLIQYRVQADSQFEDEIEYEWEFDDGASYKGRTIEREMSYWPEALNGYITENIYLRVKIPRLNISYRNSDPYEIKVLKPYIKGFAINCKQDNTRIMEWTCFPNPSDKSKPSSSAGGDIKYEWIFNGQTYSGYSQRFTVPTTDQKYPVLLTATIEDTNINVETSFNIETNDKSISINCNYTSVEKDVEGYLELRCQPMYNRAIHANVTTFWYFGDGYTIQAENNEVKHTYNKAGIYTIKMDFQSEQQRKINFTSREPVLFKPIAYTTVEKSSDTASVCGGSIYNHRKAVYRNNFDLFNQNDFIIENKFEGGGSCKCDGLNKTDNIWYKNGDDVHGWCWGNLSQQVYTKICAKGFPEKCVTNY